jgi:hypothetical protein
MRCLTCLMLLAVVFASGCDSRRAARLRGDVDETSPVTVIDPSPPIQIVDEPPAVKTLANVVNDDADDPYTMYYQPGNVITVRGGVTGLYRFPMSHGRTGVLARLHVDGGQPLVYLGPANYLFENDFDPQITSYMAATGTPHVAADGRTIIIARDATLRDLRLRIRDEDGNPLYPLPVTTRRVE